MTRALLLAPLLAASLLILTLYPQPALAGASFEGLTIRGVALGPEGESIAGQAVLIPLVSGFELARSYAEGQARPPAVDRARLGADGAFLLEAPEVGFWVVAVEAPEMTTAEFYLSPLTEDADLPTLLLEPAGERRIVVQDRTGKPVTAALVLGLPAGPRRQGRTFRGFVRQSPWSTQRLLGRTDDQGRAQLRPSEDVELDVVAWAPGFLPSRKVRMESGTVEIVLEAGMERRLRVVQPSGRPAVGVLVEIGELAWPAGWTDEAGRLTLIAPPSGTLPLTLSTEEVKMAGLRLPGPDPRPMPGEAGAAEAETVFTLAQPRQLEARVVEEDSDRAIPDAIVWQPEDAPGFCRTGRSGACTLRLSSQESQESQEAGLLAAASGYRSTHREVAPSSSASKLILRPAAEIRGRVLDGRGASVAGAEITAGNAWGHPGLFQSPASGTARTREDGSFRISGVEAESRLRVTASKEGFAPTDVEVVTARAGEAAPAVVIVLSAGAGVFGFVVDENDLAVVGADVWISPTPEAGNLLDFSRRRWPAFSERTSLTTDEEGRFEAVHLVPGAYDVSAAAPGFAPRGLRGVELPDGGPAVEIGPLILARGAVLEGRVTDADGIPIGEAEVEAWGERGGSLMPSLGLRSGGRQSTDLDGYFRISDLTPGEKHQVAVRREGYLGASLPGVQVPLNEPLEITLEPAFVVRGRILDPGGEAVADGRALLLLEEGREARPRVFRDRRHGYSGQSDAEGRFAIEKVPPGIYLLSASASGFQPSRKVSVEAGPKSGEKLHELVLVPGAKAAGRVFAPDGEPLEGARVWMRKVSEEDDPLHGNVSTMTDGAGEYQLEGVPSGTVEVSANHPEHTRASKEVQVPAGGAVTVDLTLAPGYQVSGRVVQASGEPVVGADVQLAEESTGSGRSSIGVVSGLDGQFSFEGVASGRYQVSSGTLELPASTREEIEVEGADVYGLEVVLSGGTTIRGLVMGLDDAELAKAEVRAVKIPRALYQAKPRQDGSYRLGPLSPGVWSLEAVVGSGGRQRGEQVNVEEGVEEILVDFVFTLGADLQGRVFEGGEPLPGAWVRLEGLDVGTSASGRTDFEGRFQLKDLEEGTYWLTARHPVDGAEYGQEVNVGTGGPVEIEMPAGVIAGRISSAEDGAPVARAELQVSPADSESGFRSVRSRSARADAEGRFRLEGFAEGSWRIVASKPGFAQAERLVTLGGSGVEDLEISLQRTEGLLVDVVLPDGRPASIVKALLFDGAGRFIGFREMQGERGRFHLESAPPGRWYLQLSAEQEAAATSLVVEAPGKPIPVQLQAAGWLSLRVPPLEESRRPATVSIRSTAGVPYLPNYSYRSPQRETFHLHAGRLHRQLLPPGAWQLEATAADGTSWTGTAEIEAGTAVEVVLE